MNKKIKRFLCLFLLAILFVSPYAVSALIKVTKISAPEIGKTPGYAVSNRYMKIQDQIWINRTDHTFMKSTDKFEAGKLYEYRIIYTLKNENEEDTTNIFDDLFSSEYFLGFPEYSYDMGFSGYLSASPKSMYFYMGDPAEAEVTYDTVTLDIDAPQLGGNPTYASTSEKYTVSGETWYNLTDGKEMKTTDTFENGKKYKYTINFSTAYYYNDMITIPDYFDDFLKAFSDSEYYLGEVYEEESGIVDETISGVFYFGDSEDLIINTDAIEINDFTPLEVGGKLVYPEVTVSDDIVRYRAIWLKETENNGWKVATEGETIEAGKKYLYDLMVQTLPGHSFTEDFEFIGGSVDDNVLSEEIETSALRDGGFLEYMAVYAALPENTDIAIVSSFGVNIYQGYQLPIPINYLYPNYAMEFKVFPNTEANAEVTWESSNEEVATIDEDGVLTAIKTGTTTITATNANGDSATYELTIGVPIESVELEEDKVELHAGKEYRIQAEVLPENATNNKLTYSSSNFSVADVDKYGTIRALREGTAMIFINEEEEESQAGRVLNVTVLPRDDSSSTDVTGIQLDKTSVTIGVGEDKTVKATLTPSTATSSITWESLDTSVATVKDGVITGVGEGTTTITATTENNLTASVTVKVTNEMIFKDVNKNDWYYETVKFVSENKIILGYNATTFAPNDNITRGQLVTILWRLNGEPNASSLPNNFSDVDENYYTEAIKWATAEGIIHGYGGTNKFGPNDPIIRQDLAVILTNYYRQLWGVSEEEIQSQSTAYLSKFADYNLVKGTYAEQSLRWVVSMGIMNGKNVGKPKKEIQGGAYATRAEAAAMVMNFIKALD